MDHVVADVLGLQVVQQELRLAVDLGRPRVLRQRAVAERVRELRVRNVVPPEALDRQVDEDVFLVDAAGHRVVQAADHRVAVLLARPALPLEEL